MANLAEQPSQREWGVDPMKGVRIAAHAAAGLILGAAVPAALYGLYRLAGGEDGDIAPILHHAAETITNPDTPFILGVGVGVAKNAALMGLVLHHLSAPGKVAEGSLKPNEEKPDGTRVFYLQCGDRRRKSKDGGVVFGGYGPLGAGFNGVLLGLAADHLGQDTPIGRFLTGYFMAGNALSFLLGQTTMIQQILAIDRANPGEKLQFVMKIHRDGCGAETWTGLLNYALKWLGHHDTAADALALPNEATGYGYVNAVLGPLVSQLGTMLGRNWELSASIEPSQVGPPRK